MLNAVLLASGVLSSLLLLLTLFDIVDLDLDVPGLSLRGISLAISVFSFGSLFFRSVMGGGFLSLALGFFLGILAFGLTFLFELTVAKFFKGKDVVSDEDYIGEVMEVYLTIPKGGKGRIMGNVRGMYVERDAVSTANRDLKPGERVVVVGFKDGYLWVEPLED